MYDNQRLFAQNDWRVWARSHDGLRLNYKKVEKKLEASAVIAYNQSAENFFGSGYTPKDVSSEDHKLLNIFSYKQKYKKGFSLFLLHAGDGFESTVADQKKKLKMRYTTGGRSGNRAEQAKEMLESAGYTNAENKGPWQNITCTK